MPLIADLIDPDAAERLAAAVQEQAGQRQAAAPVTVCEACGQRLPGQRATSAHDERPRAVPAAVFRSGSGAEHPRNAERADPSRARA